GFPLEGLAVDAREHFLDGKLGVAQDHAVRVERAEGKRREAKQDEKERPHPLSSACRKHPARWSFTIPVACMKAYMMVVPTNLNPRVLRSFDRASDTSVRVGTSPRYLRLPWSGFPPTKPQT